MEYVVVRFPEDRLVFVDGKPAGNTNQILLIESGTHEFNLGPVQDYKPYKQLAIVTNTTSISPVEIRFEK